MKALVRRRMDSLCDETWRFCDPLMESPGYHCMVAS